MMRNTTLILSLAILVSLLTACSPGNKLTTAEKRKAIDTMADETLQWLYQEKVSTQDEIKNAVGYAAFSNANVNIVFASGGGGYGVVINNETGEKTYMKMGMGGIGLGLGVKDYRQILIFNELDAYKNFIYSGWKFGGHADAAAKAGHKGGEVSGEAMIGSTKVYSMTESGLALQATVAGTKYWKDDELN